VLVREYVKFGSTEMDASKICLGCISFGDASTGFQGWSLKEDESNAIIKRTVELGINFFDTANCYSFGTSEEYLGRTLKEYTKRDETDHVQRSKYGFTEKEDQAVIDRVAETAEKRGITCNQVSLAWLMQKGCAPVTDATKIVHLADSVGSVGITLTGEEIAFLEEPDVPYKTVGPLVPEPNWIHSSHSLARGR